MRCQSHYTHLPIPLPVVPTQSQCPICCPCSVCSVNCICLTSLFVCGCVWFRKDDHTLFALKIAQNELNPSFLCHFGRFWVFLEPPCMHSRNRTVTFFFFGFLHVSFNRESEDFLKNRKWGNWIKEEVLHIHL